jgi:hypothetical protein
MTIAGEVEAKARIRAQQPDRIGVALRQGRAIGHVLGVLPGRAARTGVK